MKKLKGKNKNETLKIPAQTSEIFEKFNDKGNNVFAFVWLWRRLLSTKTSH